MAFTPSILNVIGIGTARVFYAFEENSQRQDQQIDKNNLISVNLSHVIVSTEKHVIGKYQYHF